LRLQGAGEASPLSAKRRPALGTLYAASPYAWELAASWEGHLRPWRPPRVNGRTRHTGRRRDPSSCALHPMHAHPETAYYTPTNEIQSRILTVGSCDVPAHPPALPAGLSVEQYFLSFFSCSYCPVCHITLRFSHQRCEPARVWGPQGCEFNARPSWLPESQHDLVYARRLLLVLQECSDTGQVEATK